MNLQIILEIIDAVPPWAVGIGFVLLMVSVAVTLPFSITKTSIQDVIANVLSRGKK
jgi:hypothetical protein